RIDQVGQVAGPEEALHADEQLGIVLVPADALAGPERLDDPGRDLRRRDHALEAAEDAGGAFVRPEGGRGGVGARVAARRRGAAGARLPGEPLADVALGGARARGELGGREAAGPGHGPVEPELVADVDERGGERPGDVAECLVDECLNLFLSRSHQSILLWADQGKTGATGRRA